MLTALTHAVPKCIDQCELTHIVRVPIDFQLAVAQHRAYCDALRRAGAAVMDLNVNASYPDACFVEDTAVVLDEVAVIARMGVESRRGEESAIEHVLSQHREIARIASPGTLEGGDVLVAGKTIFTGVTPRTNAQGIRTLAEVLRPHGYEVLPATVRGCLHLKSACTLVGERLLLANPDWIDTGQFTQFEIIDVAPEEPSAANTLRIAEKVFLASAFPRTADKLRGAGLNVELLDVSEFIKAEAGLTCSSILFEA